MTPCLTAAVVLAAPAATVPTEVWQVAPETAGKPWWQPPTTRKDRAVLLVPGVKLHPLKPLRVTRPELHDWQESRSELVRALAPTFDVFSFGYAQTAPLDVIAHSPGLRDVVAQLRAAGYRDVVLIGHSAGGVIVRLFAENYPDAGVTKVIQVAAPNEGSELAAVIKTGYPKVQAPFIQSLAPAARAEAKRPGRAVGPKVEMACVVCKVKVIDGDGLVPLASQWPTDLQQQGVPAALVPVSHWEVMRTTAGVRVIAELARERLTRWAPDQTDRARKILLREPDDRK